MIAAGLLLAASLPAAEWPRPARELPKAVRQADARPDTPAVPAELCRIDLGDATYFAQGGGQPDACVRFSPDGRRLAVGTFFGRLRLHDVYADRPVWERRLAEGLVKQVAFSPDGATLYYGEQSPDGFVGAADAATGRDRWRFRLADELETSPPPAKDDVYGAYQLPGCFRLQALADGDLLVLGLHAWGDWRRADGMRRLSRLYRLAPDGRRKWAFPAAGPMPLTMIQFAAPPAGAAVAVLVSAKASNTPADCPYQPGTLVLLDANTGEPRASFCFPPLAPHYDRVSFWQSLAVSPDGRRAAVGLEDGRTFFFSLPELKVERIRADGAPLLVSGLPISANACYPHLAADGRTYLQTGSSSLPQAGTMLGAARPPGPHPRANTLIALNPTGEAEWFYRSGQTFQRAWTSADGRWLLVPVRGAENAGPAENGALLFDTRRTGAGPDKLVFYYPLAGAPFLEADLAADGSAFALVEVPARDTASGALEGAYRVLVVR